MANDTQQKKESLGMANPDQPKMPKYEYQQNDTRSFSVDFRTADCRSPKSQPSENATSSLKVF